MTNPIISIVLPVYNEEDALPIMFGRLLAVMDAYGKPYEVLFVNDGSTDNSQALLADYFSKRPDVVRVVQFIRNYGQYPAIMAGLQHARGDIAVTLDCNLQNPPEEIPKLLQLCEKGHDVVGGIRTGAKQTKGGKFIAKMSNQLRDRITRIHVSDHDCTMRAYRRHIINQIIESGDASPCITALSQYLASNPAEVEVAFEDRKTGKPERQLSKLLRYDFDLMTGFSLAPLQLFTLVGIILSGISLLLFGYLIFERLFIGPQADGVFTLFAFLFFLISVMMTGLGILGEYVGRIYNEVHRRPRYAIKHILEKA